MMNSQHSIHSFSMGAFVWWTGVIEDRFDPKELGRMRVRMLGYHTADKSQIPTESLFWAYPSQPTTSAAISGVGSSPTGMVEGTHCWGFFRDGHNAQDPIICGSWGGIPQDPAQSSRGFHDPNGQYPRSELVGEPDTNRLARGDTTDTVIQKKNESVDSGVSVAGGGSWSEPPSPYAAKYPYNHVHESESGHVHEIDDTPGGERLHRYHTSGSCEEIHPDGVKVIRVVNDNYEIIAGGNFVHIKGVCNITVDGNANIKVGGNSNIETGGNHTESVGGNMEMTIGGTCNITSGGPLSLKAPTIHLNE